MTQIRVKDFGPIAEASFELKPLTVFMGPNGTGKSYLALAAYCLFRTLAGSVQLGPYRAASRLMARGRIRNSDLSRRIRKEVVRAWPNPRAIPRSSLRIEDMPKGLQDVIRDVDSTIGESLTSEFASELERCYGTKVADLVRRGSSLDTAHMGIQILNSDGDFDWAVSENQGQMDIRAWSSQYLEQNLDFARIGLPISVLIDDPDYFLTMAILRRDLRVPEALILGNHYMPASRSGILLGHRTFAAVIVGQVSRSWLQPIEIPRLPGAVTDLIEALLLLERRPPPGSKLQEAIDYLEGNVIKGKVGIEIAAEYPEIYYENDSGRYMFHQVSSMVSEIAPIILYLKYLVRPGQLFIIEEPESHIDAENQRRLARAIAMLVNAGVKVLITTHSDYFVSQLNNLLLLSEVSRRRRPARKYAANEILHPDTVGAYQFNPGPDGTIVETLHVTADGGIPITPFTDAHGALYDEAIALEHAST